MSLIIDIVIHLFGLSVVFSGIIGGIWLVCIGYWKFVIFVFVFNIFSHHLASILLLPSLGYSFLVAKKLENGQAVYIMPCIVLTCMAPAMYATFIFSYGLELFGFIEKIPLFLVLYCSAIRPWITLSSYENYNTATLISTYSNSFLCFVISILLYANIIAVNSVFFLVFIPLLLINMFMYFILKENI